MGMRLIKAFVRYRREIDRFDRNNTQLMERTAKALRLIETTMPVLLLLMNISILVILWFGNWQMGIGGVSAGDAAAIVIYATRITGIFGLLSHILMSAARARASARRIQEVLQAEDRGEETQVWEDSRAAMGAEAEEEGPAAAAAEAPCLGKEILGKLEFEAVTFRYPGTSEPVLRDLSFVVQPGETVAVMGATGSGKSSMFQLIPRLFQPERGRILIDGIDIRDLPLEEWRRSIGMVPQEVVLFTGTIADNIRWGQNDASLDEVMEAAKHAQIHETILGLSEGYGTIVGQKGVNLSGGQKQRLSIARALIRKPRLLLLDDSTSALDLKTEARLLQALKRYDCTTLIITQKVSTAMQADRVLLLDQGRIISQGTHEELTASSDLYRRIVASQFGEKG